MPRTQSRSILTIASLLALLMIGATSLPAQGAPKRFEATERLALKLTNCLRTGGKVTRAGRCKGMGSGRYSRKRAPLKRSRRVSNRIALPWARRTVKTNICGHSLAGSTVDRRFRWAGLRHRDNGENIGCGTSWTPRRMVIRVVRWWQAEKSYNGGHWRQLKDRRFKVAGVAVVKHASGRSRVVVNFYGRRVR